MRRCISRRSADEKSRNEDRPAPTSRVLYWSVQTGRIRRPKGAMAEQIEIPASFPAGADVSGKRVVITGAGRGLGRLLAHAFSNADARGAARARRGADRAPAAEQWQGRS